jgi:excisionase family DNA binding protein
MTETLSAPRDPRARTMCGMPRHTSEPYGSGRQLLTREQVAKQLGVSPRTVARLALESGELPYVRIGRLARFRPADVTALIERRLNDERPAGRPGAVTTSAEQGRCDGQ